MFAAFFIKKVQFDGKSPKILIMAPPPLGKHTESAETFQGGVDKSKQLADMKLEN
jgi:hypothetical protein